MGHGSQYFRSQKQLVQTLRQESARQMQRMERQWGIDTQEQRGAEARGQSLRASTSTSTQARSVSLKPRLLWSAKCITFQQNGERFPCNTYNCYDILMDFFYRLHFLEQF